MDTGKLKKLDLRRLLPLLNFVVWQTFKWEPSRTMAYPKLAPLSGRALRLLDEDVCPLPSLVVAPSSSSAVARPLQQGAEVLALCDDAAVLNTSLQLCVSAGAFAGSGHFVDHAASGLNVETLRILALAGHVVTHVDDLGVLQIAADPSAIIWLSTIGIHRPVQFIRLFTVASMLRKSKLEIILRLHAEGWRDTELPGSFWPGGEQLYRLKPSLPLSYFLHLFLLATDVFSNLEGHPYKPK